MPTAINRETGERLVLTDGGWVPIGGHGGSAFGQAGNSGPSDAFGGASGAMPVDTSAESSWEYLERTKPTHKKESLREFMARWNKWNAGLINKIVGDVSPFGYRTEGRRRSDNVIDVRWNVPGETPEQKSARLWAAHDRGVGLARTMIPTIVSRNPKLEGKKLEPVFFEGSDRLIPTAADMARIMEGARSVDVSAFDPPSRVR